MTISQIVTNFNYLLAIASRFNHKGGTREMTWTIRQVQEANDEQIPFLAQHAICLAKRTGKDVRLAIAEVLAKATMGPITFEKVWGEVFRQGYRVEGFIVEGNLAVAPLEEQTYTEG